MPKGSNKMYNNSDEQFINMQYIIQSNKQYMKANKQDYDEKMMKITEDFKNARIIHNINHESD